MKSGRPGEGPSFEDCFDPDRGEEARRWWMAGRPHPRKVAMVLQQLALMARNGVDLGRALQILAEQNEHPRLSHALREIYRAVSQHGMTLSDAMGLCGDYFSPTARLLVRAGELGGELDGRLERAALLIERQCKLVDHVKQSLTSPLITAAASAGAVFLIFKFVMPKFLVLYSTMAVKLPWITRAVLALISAMNSRLFLVAMAANLLALFLMRARLKEELFNLSVQLPFTRGLVGTILCSQFCDVVSFLVKDGVKLPQALALLVDSAPQRLHRERLRAMEKKLLESGDLCEAMVEVPYFPPVMNSMAMVASESGDLARVFRASSDFMQQQYEAVLDTAVLLVEPFVIFCLGTVMSVVFVAMFLPIYQVLSNLGA